jgi:hypothetical protein
MKKKIILLIIIILIILIWAPWMANNWCKSRLIGYEFNGYESVSESWRISVSWMPFGRKVEVFLPETEAPPPSTIGGWGFEGYMLFFGNIYSVVGR